MKKKFWLFGVMAAALVFGLLAAGCGSSPKAAAPDLTGVSSYYVRADGDDKNAGTSEAAPFKTLQRAVEAAAKTPVKKITVIGTIAGNTTIQDADPTVKKIIKVMDATGGQDLAEVLGAQTGVATVQGSLDDPDPEEILITGKPDAAGTERAMLVPPVNNNNAILIVLNSTVRLEHIELSGLNDSTKQLPTIFVSGTATLAQGAKITKNISKGYAGIYALYGLVIMRDNAEVSHNEGSDNVGVYLERGSVMAMFDNALITGNKAAQNGGGVAMQGSTLIMRGNSAISGNSAGNGGGGIITFPDTENGYISQITMEDNAVVSGNTAAAGGGVLLQDKLILRGNAKIIENTATEIGGGVFGATRAATVNKGADAVIENNQAPEAPDSNFTFE
jgi:hypothetical protein